MGRRKLSSKNKTSVIRLRVLRRKSPDKPSYWQEIDYCIKDAGVTVAGALTEINGAGPFKDISGKTVEPIRWECGCLQKKCGACAMIINGRPYLACDSKLTDFVGKVKKLTIEPLRKFPIVADLVVDRSRLHENLKAFELWSEENLDVRDKTSELVYEASKCIQCGCCLEVCPNFSFDEEFFGASAFVSASRMLPAMSESDRLRLSKEYDKHVFAGCGKSLACKDICPRHIDCEKMLLNSNAIAVWRRNEKK